MTDEAKFAIMRMVKAGMKQSYVAATFKVSKKIVSKIVKKENSKSKQVIKKQGPKFKYNTAAVRILGRILVKNNTKPLHFTVSEPKENYKYKLSARTVRRYAYRISLRNFAAVSKPFLSTRHVKARKQWANMHKQWDIDQWGKVAFSDESTFIVKPTSLRKSVWRKVGDRYKTINPVPTFKSEY